MQIFFFQQSSTLNGTKNISNEILLNMYAILLCCIHFKILLTVGLASYHRCLKLQVLVVLSADWLHGLDS